MNPIVAHLIGDFLLQNDWMASNKKCRTSPCIIHVLLYLIPFLFASLEWWQILLIGLQHFAQDRTNFVFWWIRVWKRVPSEQMGFLPFAVDQSFHIAFIEIVILFGNYLHNV